MDRSLLRLAAATIAAIGLVVTATIAQGDPAGKWCIAFDDRADNDGSITIPVSPEAGIGRE